MISRSTLQKFGLRGGFRGRIVLDTADPALPFPFETPAGTSLPAGLATEADTALALAKLKLRAVGISAETDSAQTVALRKILAVGVATESDTALALASTKRAATGLAAETDTALQLALPPRVREALETDTALGLAARKVAAAGRSDETDTALALALAKSKATGRSDETDASLTRAIVKIIAAGRGDETDSAIGLSFAAPTLSVGIATESDAALALGLSGGAAQPQPSFVGGGRRIVVGPQVRRPAPEPEPIRIVIAVGAAGETDRALAAGGLKRVARVGLAVEMADVYALEARKLVRARIAWQRDFATRLKFTKTVAAAAQPAIERTSADALALESYDGNERDERDLIELFETGAI
jgi:hypothetical protein